MNALYVAGLTLALSLSAAAQAANPAPAKPAEHGCSHKPGEQDHAGKEKKAEQCAHNKAEPGHRANDKDGDHHAKPAPAATPRR